MRGERERETGRVRRGEERSEQEEDYGLRSPERGELMWLRAGTAVTAHAAAAGKFPVIIAIKRLTTPTVVSLT